MKATAITSHTLVGIQKSDFPLKRGNCFSMRTQDNDEYRIVNFSVENLEWLMERGLTFPIEIDPLDAIHHAAVIIDPRIPDEFFDMTFCEVCCPKELLPQPQKLRIARQVKQGFRIEEQGGKFGWIRYDHTKRPLKRHFTGEPEPPMPQFKCEPISFQDVRRKP